MDCCAPTPCRGCIRLDRVRAATAYIVAQRRVPLTPAEAPDNAQGRRCVVQRGMNSAEAMEYLGMRRMVAPIRSVGADSKHAHRKRAAAADHSSTAHGVDVEALIAEADHPCHERCPA